MNLYRTVNLLPNYPPAISRRIQAENVNSVFLNPCIATHRNLATTPEFGKESSFGGSANTRLFMVYLEDYIIYFSIIFSALYCQCTLSRSRNKHINRKYFSDLIFKSHPF